MPRSRLASAALVGLVVALAAPRPAGALVLSEDELEDTSTEVGVVARTFAFVMFGDVLKLMGTNPMGMGIFDLRGYFAKRTRHWKLVVHDQLSTSVRSDAWDSELAFGRGTPPPRWLPLSWDLTDDPTMTVKNSVDWLYASYTRGSLTITAGRQPITFGRGKLWKPSDLVGAFTLTEVDTEYKPGADALRVDWSPSASTTATLVAAAGELGNQATAEPADQDDFEANLNGSAALARVKHSLGKGEIGFLGGYVRRDVVVGVDGVWDTGSFEIYGEATATWVADRPASAIQSPTADEGDVVGKALIGATFRHGKLTFGPEAFYDGFGAAEPETYLAVATSGRVAVGEQTTLGKAYLGGVADWEAHPLVHVVGMGLANLYDPSGLVSIGLNYSIADNALAQLGGYLPLGRTPRLGGPGGITLHDEYGLYPYFLFFELKAIL